MCFVACLLLFRGLVFKFYSCENEKALNFSTSTVFTILVFSAEGQAELQYLVVVLDGFQDIPASKDSKQ